MPWMNIYCVIHYFVEEGLNEFKMIIYTHYVCVCVSVCV